ncbi:DEAD/DEAH box helicase [Pelagibaculum spongiae]|uniref:DEAD/DEAH box helicase n=1 Tax=Pelagibaculum spongiae TaxID=2080658 RepID=A0A2V1H183_9GAMM|nr:DEAD/DEAH box helicase [Pelagibaculum spongiae]PVZ72253.1 DEAD/DEAH box helicase [Pelagibaculum spongiae]
MSFQSLALDASLLKALAELNYLEPTPVQQQAIPEVLAGYDLMAGAQTGTGKTAAFALPILQGLLTRRDALAVEVSAGFEVEAESDDFYPAQKPTPQIKALVLTPTRELAQQVHASFVKYGEHTGLNCQLAYGGVSLTPQLKALKDGADVLVATPGRLLDLVFKKAINIRHLSYFVLDEADRMLDMGFNDEIQKIIRQLPKLRQTMLFSASFNDSVFKLAKSFMNQPKRIAVDASHSAAVTVEQKVYLVDPERKRELVSHLIGSKNWRQVLVFSRTKQGADELAKEMCKDGLKTVAIHGDKSQGARERGLAQFKAGEVRVLVATDVAARGLDIAQLNVVINFDLPYIADDYVHRIGRTGRAGQLGLAITLMSMGEEYLLEEIEVLMGDRLPQQWLKGYEPDLTREIPANRKNSRSAEKQRAKKRAFSKVTSKGRGGKR